MLRKQKRLLQCAFATLALTLLGQSPAMAQSIPTLSCQPELECSQILFQVPGYSGCDDSRNACVEDPSVEPCSVREVQACADNNFVLPPAPTTLEQAITLLKAYHAVCDDGNPATIDACQANKCHHYPKDLQLGCNPAECTEDAQCDDGDLDTVNWCDAGSCHSTERWGDACTEVDWWGWCYRDRHCNDRDPGTVDWCDWGQCMHQRRGSRGDVCEPAPECVRDRDCRDGDRSTKNWCHEGSCHSVEKDDPACLDTNLSCTRNRDCVAAIAAAGEGEPLQDYVTWCREGTCRVAAKAWDGECQEGTSVEMRP